MLQLDGGVLEMGGRDFTYKAPKKWGPGDADAFITITARPAASVNAAFRKNLDAVMHEARLRDFTVEEKYKKDGDKDAYVEGREAALKWVTGVIAELRYDNCIIAWHSNIQSDEADIEPTRENFLGLAAYEHPDLQTLFAEVWADLQDFDKFTVEARSAVIKDEEKN